MCGRMSLYFPKEDLEARFDAHLAEDVTYRPRYNIAPDSSIEIITSENPDEIDQYTWGFIPNLAGGPEQRFINARSETAHEKPAFRDAWVHRPCLVLTSGFYEWKQRNGGPKEPYRIYRPDNSAFALAGLWEKWTPETGDPIRTVTILTTEANAVVRPIHDRMPVVLPREREDEWLVRSADDRRDLIRPVSADLLDAHPISTMVNDPSNDDPRVIEPLRNEQAGLDRFK